MKTVLKLPNIDLSSPEKLSTSRLIRQACLDHGFFYLTNHGVSEELMEVVLMESKKLFSLPLDDKMLIARRELRGYSPLYDEKLESSSTSKGDSKEMFTFGPSGVWGQLYPNECGLLKSFYHFGGQPWKATKEMSCFHLSGTEIISTSDSVKPSPRILVLAEIYEKLHIFSQIKICVKCLSLHFQCLTSMFVEQKKDFKIC